jgi:hypothetical protein
LFGWVKRIVPAGRWGEVRMKNAFSASECIKNYSMLSKRFFLMGRSVLAAIALENLSIEIILSEPHTER